MSDPEQKKFPHVDKIFPGDDEAIIIPGVDEAALLEDFAKAAYEASGNDHPDRSAYCYINGQRVHAGLAWMLWLDEAENYLAMYKAMTGNPLALQREGKQHVRT